MSPDLSRRLARIIDQVPLDTRSKFIKRVSVATTWEDLSTKDQSMVLQLEGKSTKTLKVEEPYDRMETKELELSTIHRYYMGSKLVAEIVIIYTDRSKKKIKSQERRI